MIKQYWMIAPIKFKVLVWEVQFWNFKGKEHNIQYMAQITSTFSNALKQILDKEHEWEIEIIGLLYEQK